MYQNNAVVMQLSCVDWNIIASVGKGKTKSLLGCCTSGNVNVHDAFVAGKLHGSWVASVHLRQRCEGV